MVIQFPIYKKFGGRDNDKMLIPILQDTSIEHFFQFPKFYYIPILFLETSHVIREIVSSDIKITAVRLSKSNKLLKFIMELNEKKSYREIRDNCTVTSVQENVTL